MNETEVKLTKDTVIGDAIKRGPLTKKVIEKYFGSGCFTCPGLKMESIAFGASMHGVDIDILLNELNKIKEME
ncbi:MAG: DUF1858 domain-containing protein [Nitrospirota bacterium]